MFYLIVYWIDLVWIGLVRVSININQFVTSLLNHNLSASASLSLFPFSLCVVATTTRDKDQRYLREIPVPTQFLTIINTLFSFKWSELYSHIELVWKSNYYIKRNSSVVILEWGMQVCKVPIVHYSHTCNVNCVYLSQTSSQYLSHVLDRSR